MTPTPKLLNGPHFTAEVDVPTGRLVLHGELDLCAAELLSQLHPDLLTRAASCVSVSLADVGFIDAAGIGALIRLRNELHRAGGRLLLTHAGDGVARVFRHAGLTHLLLAGAADAHPAAPPAQASG